MCCGPRPQHEASRAESQIERAADEQRRWHDADLIDQLVAHGPAKCIEIELSARSQRTRQVRVTDKGRSVLHESAIAEHVIGMAMRVDDVADRLAGPGANGCHQLSSLAEAATRIDHGDRILSNDEADIGDRAVVLARHLRGLAVVHEYAIRNGIDGQLPLLRARGCHRSEHRERGKDQCGTSHVSASVQPRSAIGNSMLHRGSVCVAARATSPPWGLFLLQAPIDKLSILAVCGFNGTSLVRVADIFRSWQPWWAGSAAAFDDICRAKALAGDFDPGDPRRARRARYGTRADQ